MKDSTGPKTTAQHKARHLLNEGANLLREGNANKAISLLKRARQLDPGSVPILLNLGGAYVMAGRHKEALEPLEAARQAEPENAMVWINLGAAYLGNPVLATPEQQLDAIRAFEHALALDPAAPSVHYNLGLIFVDRDETDLAAAAFRKAVQVNPYDHDARRWLQQVETRARKERSGE